LFARDVDGLADFYASALGLEETVNDAPRYRELAGGGANIGFAFSGAYELLALDAESEPTGLRSVATFVLPHGASMDAAVARAVEHGASVAKPPYDTHFGQRMAVLRDPEGNAFRLNGELPG
jgi:predicted enzyme related to lactoylglutathione lyase